MWINKSKNSTCFKEINKNIAILRDTPYIEKKEVLFQQI